MNSKILDTRNILSLLGYNNITIHIVIQLINFNRNIETSDYISYAIGLIGKYDIENRGIENMPKSLKSLVKG